MTNIERISKIKGYDLSTEYYLQSLLEQGYMAKMLSDFELEQMQIACLTLLAKKTERFNSGDSSSIRIEKAQDILNSIMFTIGVKLKTYKNPDDAILCLKQNEIESIYKDGCNQIEHLLKESKVCHKKIKCNLMQSENVFYRATIVDGINGFFKLYSPEFSAHEIHITADYPTYNKTKKLLGIEFVRNYLEQLYYENMFCTRFYADDIHHLLCGYDEHYENLLFNIYEPILAATLGCVIAGMDESRLDITPKVQLFLYNHFIGKTSAQVEVILAKALSSLSLTDKLQVYVKESLPILASAIENAVKMGSVDRIFIVPEYPENKPKLTVSYGERMKDELYRKVLSKFMSSNDMSRKIDIIEEHINSLVDLNDLLLDSELTKDEIKIILKERPPAEIVALMKKYNIEYEMNFTELRDCEKTLCEGLFSFVSSLPLKQQEILKKAAEILKIDGDVLATSN